MAIKNPIFTIAVAETLTILTLILGIESFPILAVVSPIFAAIIPAVTVIAIFFLFMTILKKNAKDDISVSAATKTKTFTTVLAQLQLITFFLFYSSKMFIIFGKIATVSAFFSIIALLNSNLLFMGRTPDLHRHNQQKVANESKIASENISEFNKEVTHIKIPSKNNPEINFTQEEVGELCQRLRKVNSNLSEISFDDDSDYTNHQKHDLIPMVQAMTIAVYAVCFIGNLLLELTGKSMRSRNELKSSNEDVNIKFTPISSTSLANYAQVILNKETSPIYDSNITTKKLVNNTDSKIISNEKLSKRLSNNAEAPHLTILGFQQFTILSFVAIASIKKQLQNTYRF